MDKAESWITSILIVGTIIFILTMIIVLGSATPIDYFNKIHPDATIVTQAIVETGEQTLVYEHVNGKWVLVEVLPVTQTQEK